MTDMLASKMSVQLIAASFIVILSNLVHDGNCIMCYKCYTAKDTKSCAVIDTESKKNFSHNCTKDFAGNPVTACITNWVVTERGQFVSRGCNYKPLESANKNPCNTDFCNNITLTLSSRGAMASKLKNWLLLAPLVVVLVTAKT